MAVTNYQYSITTDFPNDLVATGKLTTEIQNSVIVTALDSINTSGDSCDIRFKEALSSGDEDTLDGLVAAHDGVPVIGDATVLEDGRLAVSIRPQRNDMNWSTYWTDAGDDLTNNKIGCGQEFYLEEASENTDEKITFRFNAIVQALGGEAILHTTFDHRDTFCVNIKATATSVTANGSNEGNCNLYNLGGPNNLIIPADGDGTHDVDITSKIGSSSVHSAVIVPSSDNTGYYDYHVSSNTITPNYSGTGGFNLFDFEMYLSRYVSNIHLYNELRVFKGYEARTIYPHWTWEAVLHHGAGTGRSVKATFSLVLYRQYSIASSGSDC